MLKGGGILANKIEEKVQELLESILNNLGYELYDVEYAKEATESINIVRAEHGNNEYDDNVYQRKEEIYDPCK